MGHKILTAVCKCLSRFLCTCTNGWTDTPKNVTLSHKDLEEWKRIEGVDQFTRKRY